MEKLLFFPSLCLFTRKQFTRQGHWDFLIYRCLHIYLKYHQKYLNNFSWHVHIFKSDANIYCRSFLSVIPLLWQFYLQVSHNYFPYSLLLKHKLLSWMSLFDVSQIYFKVYLRMDTFWYGEYHPYLFLILPFFLLKSSDISGSVLKFWRHFTSWF